MSASNMPTELEALAFGLAETAERHSGDISRLTDQLLPLYAYEDSEHRAAFVAQMQYRLSHQARLLQFGLERIHELAAGMAAQDRALFSETLAMVDMCRFAKAAHAKDDPQSEGVIHFSEAMQLAIERVQGDLCQRFPGEEIPGN